MIRYHLGCGKRDFGKEWFHVDEADFPHIKSNDVMLRNTDDNHAEIIYASHLIEYFDRLEVLILLKQWHKVLKPGGELVVSVPNFAVISNLYESRQYEIEQFLGLLYGRMEVGNKLIYHKTVYDFRSLCRVLAESGFVNISEIKKDGVETECGFRGHWFFRLPDDHSKAVLPHMAENGIPVSLNVKCFKP